MAIATSLAAPVVLGQEEHRVAVPPAMLVKPAVIKDVYLQQRNAVLLVAIVQLGTTAIYTMAINRPAAPTVRVLPISKTQVQLRT
jgi:hypothetical protein